VSGKTRGKKCANEKIAPKPPLSARPTLKFPPIQQRLEAIVLGGGGGV
jgi:hypothetical protein